MGELRVYETPELRQPSLVIAFSGWPNAAEAATGSLTYLRDRLGAQKFAEITPEEFYDFTSLRPLIVVEGGLVRQLRFPSNKFYFWKDPQGEADLILLLGAEPHLRWGRYLDFLLQIAEQFKARRLYSLGGVYDRIPHTRQPRVSAVVNFPHLKEELASYGVEWTDYEGPSSFHSTLLMTCQEHKLEAVSLWGHAPIYIQAIRNPKVCYSLLSLLVRLLGVEVELGDMGKAGEQLEESLSKLMEQNSELREYVERFEQEYEHQERERRTGPIQGMDRILREIDDYLKGKQRRGEEPSS